MAQCDIDPATPILVGVGQRTQEWDGSAGTAPSPHTLQVAAARLALEDSGTATTLTQVIDRVAVVRTMMDNLVDASQPFGRDANPPGSLATALLVSGAEHVYSYVGGDQPQKLVSEAAEDIFAGKVRAVLIAGSEATGAMKLAQKSRIRLDWSKTSDQPLDDRGTGPELLSKYERNNGLGMPTQTYPALEHALRHRLGLSREQHLELMSELWATFSKVAEDNPHSQFAAPRTAEFLATPSRENYPIADPYLKWHVAQDAVNQGAAVIVTSVGQAQALGIDPSKWIYLHGYSAATDRLVTEREDLSRSLAIELALDHALKAAGKQASDITLFDLYSCFPCAVLLAAEALSLDWRETPATVTGGLPFFGGPGNSYSLHAIATMVEKLRDAPEEFGLVLANGGFLSKEAVGIYSAVPKHHWQPVSSADIQAEIDGQPAPALLSKSTDATIETYTVTYKRGSPSRGYVIASTPEGRILARVRTGHRATLGALAAKDPVGLRVHITHENGVNYLEPADRIGMPAPSTGLVRQFDDLLVERDGKVLLVTLNRPANMNALHTAIHFSLHEIWDEFEADDSLWVGIITGAGDRAFCAGNDLIVSAKGGDMSTPRSGFAGLCNRLDRRKPMIAAVNGVALGGGLEIALTCDLVVADERAKFALPEVKVGLFAAAGGVHRLTRQIGRKAAMELILTGRTFLADEAQALGITNEVAPAGEALTRARALAETVSGNSPVAVRASIEAINNLDTTPSFEQALALNIPIMRRLIRSKDFKEGVTAFAQKRKPNWTGS
ncbi:MAG: enoyl-CoA hydratase-related protein [Sphingobium sp.]